MELLAELRSTNFIEGLFHWLRLCCAVSLRLALVPTAFTFATQSGLRLRGETPLISTLFHAQGTGVLAALCLIGARAEIL
jgi:hypothetical protein